MPLASLSVRGMVASGRQKRMESEVAEHPLESSARTVCQPLVKGWIAGSEPLATVAPDQNQVY